MIYGLPEKLHRLRLNKGLTQRQVADRLCVSPSIISGYETCERTPSTEVLLALSYLYQCSTDFLLGKQAHEPAIVLNTEGLTEPQVQAIISLIAAFRER